MSKEDSQIKDGEYNFPKLTTLSLHLGSYTTRWQNIANNKNNPLVAF